MRLVKVIKGGDVYRKERPIVVSRVPRIKSRAFWKYSGVVLTLGCTMPVPGLNYHSRRGMFTKEGSVQSNGCRWSTNKFVINMKISYVFMVHVPGSSQLQRSRSILGKWV